jgi:two-component system LytT family sensor kinase
MEPAIPLKKLFRLALYTSPVIGILAIGTVSIVPYFFLKGFTLNQLFLFVGVITVVVFSFWSVNIGLTAWFGKPERKTVSKPVKYLLSYLLAPSMILIIRLVALCYLDERDFLKTAAPDKTIYYIYVMRFSIIFSINTIILILQDLVLIREKKTIVEIENAQLKLKNSEALNQQLRQQIHPHFLFNSLNTLKALIKRNPGDAEDYLVKLSDYLRVSISLGEVNTVSLGEELKLCSDYLDMQKMRFGEALIYVVDVPEEVKTSGCVPVFSLQVLIENAIKHNALTTEFPLRIRMKYVSGFIEVSNNVRKKQTSEASAGFGLANLAERYRILSGEEPRIRSGDSEFAVTIKVLNHADSHH